MPEWTSSELMEWAHYQNGSMTTSFFVSQLPTFNLTTTTGEPGTKKSKKEVGAYMMEAGYGIVERSCQTESPKSLMRTVVLFYKSFLCLQMAL